MSSWAKDLNVKKEKKKHESLKENMFLLHWGKK